MYNIIISGFMDYFSFCMYITIIEWGGAGLGGGELCNFYYYNTPDTLPAIHASQNGLHKSIVIHIFMPLAGACVISLRSWPAVKHHRCQKRGKWKI